MRRWSDDEDAILFKELDECGELQRGDIIIVAQAISERIPSRTESQIRARIVDIRCGRVNRPDNAIPDTPPIITNDQQPATDNEIIAKLERDVSRVKAENSNLKTRLNAQSIAGVQFEDIISSIREYSSIIPVTSSVPILKKGKIPVEVIAPISDWHGGEVVKPEHVRGHNVYNIDVMLKRAWAWLEELRTRIISVQGYYDVTRVIVPSLGDMVGGDIHNELAKTNAAVMPKVCVMLSDVLSQAFQILMGIVPIVEYVADPGNHERLTERTEHKLPENSFAYLINEMVRTKLAGYEQVGRFISRECNAWEQPVRLELSKTWLCSEHGDRKTSSAMNEHSQEDTHSAQAITDEYYSEDDIPYVEGYKFIGFLMGHTHRKYAQLRRPYRFVSGSLVGRCEFGDKVRKRVRIEHPSQFALVFGEEGQLLELWDIEPGRGKHLRVPDYHGFTVRPI